jgi:hypothetical protein
VKADKAEKRRSRRQSQGSRESEDESGGAVKVLVWTGLTATVTSLTLIVARRLAGSVWRALTRQEPPG